MYMCRGFESHLRQLIFLRISDSLECAVLLSLVVCLTLLASSFLLSSLIKTCMVVTSFKSSVITCPFMANVTQSEP